MASKLTVFLAAIAAAVTVADAAPPRIIRGSTCLTGHCVAPVQQYVAPIVKQQIVKQVVTPDVYVVQNSYPQPLVGQGGTQYISTGGLQDAIIPLLDPNPYFAQEAELAKAQSEVQALRSQRAAALFERVYELQAPALERLSAGKAASMVLDAAGLSTTAAGSQQAVIVSRDKYGRIQVAPVAEDVRRRLYGEHAGGGGQLDQGFEPPQQLEPQVADAPVKKFCAKCHGLDLSAPKGGLYLGDDAAVADGMQRKFYGIIQSLKKGSMPPAGEPQPTDAEKAAIIDALEAMIEKHAAAQ